MIFRVAFKKGDRTSIKVTDDDGKDIWMGCSDNVYSWCKKNYKEGDVVNIDFVAENGRYTANRVTRPGQSAPSNGVYKKPESKTYTKPATPTGSTGYPREYMKSKNPEESKQIRALSILSSVCSAIPAIAGQVDPNSLGEMIESLYDRFDKKII